jgi:hypothetical protein
MQCSKNVLTKCDEFIAPDFSLCSHCMLKITRAVSKLESNLSRYMDGDSRVMDGWLNACYIYNISHLINE